MDPPKSITVVLADDHLIVREGIASLFRSKSEFNIVGECSDGFVAVELILSLKPHIAVVDLNMPKLHGLEIIRKVRDRNSPTKVIVFTISREKQMVDEAFRSGAAGYVLKDGPGRHLSDAITYISDGGQYVTPLLPDSSNDHQHNGTDNCLSLLSPRERVVFGFLVDGMRPKDIAAFMDINPKTVDTYRANIMRKLDIDSLAALVKFAIQRHLTPTRSVSRADHALFLPHHNVHNQRAAF